MPAPHALVYHGPFERNFRLQKPGRRYYLPRTGLMRMPFRVPAGVRGLRFGMMEYTGKVFCIVMVSGTATDIPLPTPIPLQSGTGPNGSTVTPYQAAVWFAEAVRLNPELEQQLSKLRTLL